MSTKKNTLLGLNLLALVIVGSLLTASAVAAFSGGKGLKGNFDSEEFQAKMAEKKALMEQMQEEVDHVVTPIENGVEITVTTDNPELLEKIQNRPERTPRHPEMETETEKSVEELENGIKITITSDDPELVEKIQTRAEEKPFGLGHRPFGKRCGPGMRHPFSPESDLKPEPLQ